MIRRISLLGSTGSIGRQTLEVVDYHREKLKIVALACGSRSELLIEQALRYRPEVVSIGIKESAQKVKAELDKLGIEVLFGQEGTLRVATWPDADIIVNGVVGIAGLIPTLAAIDAGKDIALANKETLVAAGEIVMRKARERGVRVLPLDSEHSAIFQCLEGKKLQWIRRVILTASGGALRDKALLDLERADAQMALAHPNWKMGPKVTIDSATLLNKALEVVEARWLFELEPGMIDVVIHPESIVHSMVEFEDGSILAQLATPDMRLPIQYALLGPDRPMGPIKSLDITDVATLTFRKPDLTRFPGLLLGFRSLEVGGTLPCVMNAANEVAVGSFLDGQIGFMDIPRLARVTMDAHTVIQNPSLEEVLEADRWARDFIRGLIRGCF